ncbi:protein kinase [Candidatus Woesearchaeota archaeon]|nr:protein kinase [Candidatus Woesearchaeota archaeon]
MADETTLETAEIINPINESAINQHQEPTSNHFNGSYLNLPDGFEIQSLKEDKVYTIRTKFAKGGEGQSYIATDQQGNIKVVKIKELGESKQFTDFEEKVSAEFKQINEKLGTNYHVFTIDEQYLATVADYIEGRNIKEELKSRNAVFSEQEVIDVLLQLAEKYLQPLHEVGIVHRDIKPENIIASTDQEDKTKKYSLIDFGSIRQHDQLATVTGHFVGSLGYSKIKGRYEKSDDFYSLARTAYFLFTAKDPEFVAIDEFDKMADERRFKALKIDDGLRDILLKMAGHEKNKRYSSADEIIAELRNIDKRLKQGNQNGISAKKSPIVTIDVESAQKLTRYREAAEPPIALLQKIEGLKTLFAEQYAGCKADRHPLSAAFLSDLNEVMVGLGYYKETIFLDASQKMTPIVTYIRNRKDSTTIDVLHLKSTAIDNNKDKNIDDYFDYFTVDDKDIAKKLCGAAYCTKAVQKTLLKKDDHSLSINIAIGAIAVGAIFTLFTAAISYGIYSVDVKNAVKLGKEIGEYIDYFLAGLKFMLPVGLGLGGLIGYSVNKSNNLLNKIEEYNDAQSLEEALKPAAKFTYEISKLE